MAKSGQGTAYHQIIDRPELKSTSRSVIEKLCTIGGWAVLGGLLWPLLERLAALLAAAVLPSPAALHPDEWLLAACAATVQHPQIIDKPELKSPLRYFFEGSFTLALWALWIYWILPVVTLCLWYAGVKIFYQEILQGSALNDLLGTLRQGGVLVGAILAGMLGWAYYNYLWFLRRGERRNKFEHLVFDSDLAAHFGVDLAWLKQSKNMNRIDVTICGGTIAPVPAEPEPPGDRPSG